MLAVIPQIAHGCVRGCPADAQLESAPLEFFHQKAAEIPTMGKRSARIAQQPHLLPAMPASRAQRCCHMDVSPLARWPRCLIVTFAVIFRPLLNSHLCPLSRNPHKQKLYLPKFLNRILPGIATAVSTKMDQTNSQ